MDYERIKDKFIKYFTSLFFDSVYEVNPDILRNGAQISEEQKSLIDLNFSIEEVRLSLFSMAPQKALGPNGFSAKDFLQKHWILVKEDLYAAISWCLKIGTISKAMAATCI